MIAQQEKREQRKINLVSYLTAPARACRELWNAGIAFSLLADDRKTLKLRNSYEHNDTTLFAIIEAG